MEIICVSKAVFDAFVSYFFLIRWKHVWSIRYRRALDETTRTSSGCQTRGSDTGLAYHALLQNDISDPEILWAGPHIRTITGIFTRIRDHMVRRRDSGFSPQPYRCNSRAATLPNPRHQPSKRLKKSQNHMIL